MKCVCLLLFLLLDDIKTMMVVHIDDDNDNSFLPKCLATKL